MFQNFKNCLLNNKTLCRLKETFKSYDHDVYTEEVNKIALSNSDDKRLQTFGRITTYPYRTNPLKGCENEMLMVKDLFLKNYSEIVLQQ